MDGTWIVVSEAEKKMAEDIVDTLFSTCTDMEDSLKAFANNKKELWDRIHGFNIPFAKSENDISSNVVAQAAYY